MRPLMHSAANGYFEPKLPIFCDAANVRFLGADNTVCATSAEILARSRRGGSSSERLQATFATNSL